MINVPKYADSGILVHLGGGDKAHTRGFKNISIYDKAKRKWYFQLDGSYADTQINFLGLFMKELLIMSWALIPQVLISYILSIPAFAGFRAGYAPTAPLVSHTGHD